MRSTVSNAGQGESLKHDAMHHAGRPTQVTAWKTRLLEKAAGIFGANAIEADGRERIRELHEKIGELTLERD